MNTPSEQPKQSKKKATKKKTTTEKVPSMGPTPEESLETSPPLPREGWTEESAARLASLPWSLDWEVFNLSPENLTYFQDLERKGELCPLELGATTHVQTMTKTEWLAVRERLILLVNEASGLLIDWANAPNNEDDVPDLIDFAEVIAKFSIAGGLLLRLADDVCNGQVTFWKEPPKKDP